MIQKIWKPICGYEGVYEVSNCGDVRSLPRIVGYKDGRKRKFPGKVLKPKFNKANGYIQYCLSVNDKEEYVYAHRLVANAFLENDLSKPQVNHIDENKKNNCVSNLQWVTQSENMRHNGLNLRIISNTDVKSRTAKINYAAIAEKTKKKIIQLTIDGEKLNTWKGIVDASRILSIDRTAIWAALNGRNKTAGGFKWQYD